MLISLRVHVPAADWLARRWQRYLEGCEERQRRIENEQAAVRFENWVEQHSQAGDNLTEALRLAPSSVRIDFLRARRLDVLGPGVAISERYITPFGEIDVHRVFA